MNQRTTIFVNFQVDGFHYWPAAPNHLAFLRNAHRHTFHIQVEHPVTESREIEFIEFAQRCRVALTELAGQADEATGTLHFGTQSCEQIAVALHEELEFNGYAPSSITVSEDGQHGATVVRTE